MQQQRFLQKQPDVNDSKERLDASQEDTEPRLPITSNSQLSSAPPEPLATKNTATSSSDIGKKPNSEAVQSDVQGKTTLIPDQSGDESAVELPITPLQPPEDSKLTQPADLDGDKNQHQAVTGASKDGSELTHKEKKEDTPIKEVTTSSTDMSPPSPKLQQTRQDPASNTQAPIPPAAETIKEVTEIKLEPTTLVKVHSLFGKPKRSQAPKNAVVVVYQKCALVSKDGKVVGKSNTLPTLRG